MEYCSACFRNQWPGIRPIILPIVSIPPKINRIQIINNEWNTNRTLDVNIYRKTPNLTISYPRGSGNVRLKKHFSPILIDEKLHPTPITCSKYLLIHLSQYPTHMSYNSVNT